MPGEETVAGGGDGRRKVLAINMDVALFDKVAPLLHRDRFDVDRFPRAGAALELIRTVAVDVLLVAYPLPDLPLQEFLDTVRAEGSACRTSPLLLVAPDPMLGEARHYVGRGVNRVVSTSEGSETLQQEVSSLLDVAPRRALRAIVRLDVALEGSGRRLALCQTHDLSETGMLVRTDDLLPVGTRIGFEFQLGIDHVPVSGQGEVVRLTTEGRERVRGMGIHFLSFERDGWQRLRRFVRETEGEET